MVTPDTTREGLLHMMIIIFLVYYCVALAWTTSCPIMSLYGSVRQDVMGDASHRMFTPAQSGEYAHILGIFMAVKLHR